MSSESGETTRVVIFTNNYRIEGEISLIKGARLTDYVRQSRDFIAVTNAVVRERAGALLLRSKFLDVALGRVEMIMPEDMVSEGPV